MPEKQNLISPATILEAATALVRRLGEGKTNMVDIGRALGVSHAALYRFFPSKAAVMDAIVQEAMDEEEELARRWLEADGTAAERLLQMVLDIHHRKRARFSGDREIHELFRRILVERQDMIVAYAQRMTRLIEKLIAQGVERGEWHVNDVSIAAAVVRDAVTVFVHPQLLAQAIEMNAPVEPQLRATVATLTRAFEAGVDYGLHPSAD
ncbi:TetR family transcriptional regulator [Rhizobium sp. L1K21]|uniref:TetR family transcriptional regulator n=1 Tax=Rhizobium sp. L1K21 TaxID=2954933 RepID=UPI0020924B62|nr:TetR family transcriptional regulator [Rhizobium sp. L1K21]MCO6185425.1 TetR/AcrR family transcriptional regulator [Rhizobium sp. L1K21]